MINLLWLLLLVAVALFFGRKEPADRFSAPYGSIDSMP